MSLNDIPEGVKLNALSACRAIASPYLIDTVQDPHKLMDEVSENIRWLLSDLIPKTAIEVKWLHDKTPLNPDGSKGRIIILTQKEITYTAGDPAMNL